MSELDLQLYVYIIISIIVVIKLFSSNTEFYNSNVKEVEVSQ